MTEERKHAILFATTFPCARKIIDITDANEHEKMGKKHWLGVFEKEALEPVEAFTEVFARFHKPPTGNPRESINGESLTFPHQPGHRHCHRHDGHGSSRRDARKKVVLDKGREGH